MDTTTLPSLTLPYFPALPKTFTPKFTYSRKRNILTRIFLLFLFLLPFITGRARVRSNIQNVLIITKARDNRLIKLTRELALYLMQKSRPTTADGRGLVVYVDNQLRTSKRFDAAGMERDHPELFVPFPRRRSSSSNSLASMVNGYGSGAEYQMKEEGQLRYWTSDMCSRSPHLFDFVVTVRFLKTQSIY